MSLNMFLAIDVYLVIDIVVETTLHSVSVPFHKY